MRFVSFYWLFGALFVLVVAVFFIAGAVGHGRALAWFGELLLVLKLRMWDPSSRCVVKGVFVVLVVVFVFVVLVWL